MPKVTSYPNSILRRQSGQIVVEYILLLFIGVAVATLVTTTLVSRDPNSPGFLVKKWSDILTAIGSDYADDVQAAGP